MFCPLTLAPGLRWEWDVRRNRRRGADYPSLQNSSNHNKSPENRPDIIIAIQYYLQFYLIQF